jgi:hypothetical protein
LLPEEVVVLVVKTICEKSPAKAIVAMAADKRQEVVALCHSIFAIVNICKTA